MQREALRVKMRLRLKQLGSSTERHNKDREYRQLAFNEAAISKVLQYDEEEQRQATSSQTRYLQIALDSFRR